MKATAQRDLTVARPTSPAARSRRGWSTSATCFIAPVVVVGGESCLPGRVRLGLELLDQRRFANGMVFMAFLRYRTRAR